MWRISVPTFLRHINKWRSPGELKVRPWGGWWLLTETLCLVWEGQTPADGATTRRSKNIGPERGGLEVVGGIGTGSLLFSGAWPFWCAPPRGAGPSQTTNQGDSERRDICHAAEVVCSPDLKEEAGRAGARAPHHALFLPDTSVTGSKFNHRAGSPALMLLGLHPYSPGWSHRWHSKAPNATKTTATEIYSWFFLGFFLVLERLSQHTRASSGWSNREGLQDEALKRTDGWRRHLGTRTDAEEPACDWTDRWGRWETWRNKKEPSMFLAAGNIGVGGNASTQLRLALIATFCFCTGEKYFNALLKIGLF